MIKDKNEFVSTIVTNSQGKVFYFIRRDDLKLDPGKKDFISGHIKEDEIPIHAMYREIKEETGILPEEIIKFLNLGEINLPHPLLKNKKCQLYCIMINHTIEQFQESINNKAKDKEFKEIQQLDSIEDLLKDIKDTTSNWRIFCSTELEEKINMAIKFINDSNIEKKTLENIESEV